MKRQSAILYKGIFLNSQQCYMWCACNTCPSSWAPSKHRSLHFKSPIMTWVELNTAAIDRLYKIDSKVIFFPVWTLVEWAHGTVNCTTWLTKLTAAVHYIISVNIISVQKLCKSPQYWILCCYTFVHLRECVWSSYMFTGSWTWYHISKCSLQQQVKPSVYQEVFRQSSLNTRWSSQTWSSLTKISELKCVFNDCVHQPELSSLVFVQKLKPLIEA